MFYSTPVEASMKSAFAFQVTIVTGHWEKEHM